MEAIGNDYLAADHRKIPPAATFLRRILGNWGHIHGIPRLLYWSRRWALPSSPVLVDSPDGLPLTIDRDDYGQLMLFYLPYCTELRALLVDILQPGDVCLDLGANVGLLSAAMAQLVGPKGRVVAVEPNPRVAAQMRSTIDACYPGRVEVIVGGISGKLGTGNLSFQPGSFSESGEIGKGNETGEPVQLVTIDSVMEELMPGQVPDFIKVDIEGSEVELLESMNGLLSRGERPMLLVELHHDKCRRQGHDAEPVRRRLLESGYSARRVEQEGKDYRLCRKSSAPLGHENVLFTMPAHLSARPKLAARWSE